MTNETVRESLEKALAEQDNAVVEPVEVEDVADLEPETTEEHEEVAETEEGEEATETPVEAVEPPPQSWTGAAKEKWAQLPQEARAEILKREKDIHQAFTRHDGELRLGREIKEVVTPYMPIINSQGITPAMAVQQLLNADYQLRTGSPQQKAQIAMQLVQDYGIDLSMLQQPQQIDPQLAYMQQKIAELEQRANPEVLRKHLQEDMERVKVDTEVEAFASNPSNIYFDKVRDLMGALLSSGRANDLKQAYDMACKADPEISSTLAAQEKLAQDAKRKREIELKQKAAKSVVGSPSLSKPNSTAPQRTLRQELEEQFNTMSGNSTY